MESSIRHTRPEPEAWPHLMDYVQQASPNSAMTTYRRALKIARHIDTLPDTELEQNTYYSYGKIMCGLAQRLQEPETREKLTTKIAAGLVVGARHTRNIPRDKLYHPVIGDLGNLKEMGMMFTEPVTEAWSDLTPSEKLLSKVLTAATDRRRAASAMPKLRQKFSLHTVAIATYLERPIGAVVGGSLAGTTFLWRGYLAGTGMRQLPSPEQEARPIDFEKVAELAHPKNFAPIARLRLDEFFSGHGWSEKSPSTFDTSILRESPSAEIKGGVVSTDRTERLGCEALFVGRLIADVATKIFPSAMQEATTMTPKIAAKWYRA
jgi:hypothetical protein